MKRTKHRSLIIYLLIGVFAALTVAASGQTRRTALSVGDRVLASPLSLKDDKYWRTCVVTEVHNFVPKRAYSVTCEPQGSGSSSSYLVNEDWVEPAPAQTGNVTRNDAPLTEDANEQMDTPAPAAGGCPASDPDSAGKNAAERSFRGAIRRGFEREPERGADGRVTVTFQSISIGQSHPYRAYEDPNESRGKTIYPVRAEFTTCTDYNRRIVLTKRERAFSCYKNTAGEWVCDIFATAGAERKDETKSIDKPSH